MTVPAKLVLADASLLALPLAILRSRHFIEA